MMDRWIARAVARATLVSAVSCLIVGCGGGDSGSSGGGGSTPTAQAPRFTSATTASAVENTAGTFYTATATDPQGDPVTLSLHSGADAGKFVLEAGGALRFDTPPNYDLPGDAGGDNVYDVILRATAGGQSADLALRVTVTNDREGVSVRRVATGIVDPVAISFVHNQSTVLVAEAGGRVLAFDPASGSFTENTFIRDNRLPGQIVAMAYGFPDRRFQEGIYLVTHSARDGLYLQAFNAEVGGTGMVRLGDPWSRPTTASIIAHREMFVAIGSSDAAQAQNSSSPYGKLIELAEYDPYSGASLPRDDRILFELETIGDGIQKPGGFSSGYDRIHLADRGSSVEHELTIFDSGWRPLDFGWPFYEGAQAVRSNAPAAVNGPTVVYPVGDGPKEGSGIVAGLMNGDRSFPALVNTYVFADTNGTIWSIPYERLIDGLLHRSNVLEVRSEDFAPDQGEIDSPVGFACGFGSDHFYILDSDGELFRVESAT